MQTKQSKVRNRPIAITDIAISKIPRTKIPGLSNDENAIIQDCHKALLSRAKRLCTINKNLAMECAVVYNLASRKVLKVDGRTPGSVDCYLEEESRYFMKSAMHRTLIYMHNHPSTGTFSAMDLKFFCSKSSIFAMTAVGNDGSIYVIAKTGYSDCGRFMRDYISLAEQYKLAGKKNNATLAVGRMLKVADRYGLIYKKGARVK